jgi:hypothetical protein
MLDFNAKPLLAALCGGFLSLTACDQPEKSEGEGTEFRDWQTGQCIGTGSGAALTGGGKGYGVGGPLDPDDPEPWLRTFEHSAMLAMETFVAADLERDGATEACAAVCREAGLDWDDGGGCIAGGRFSVADVREAEEDRQGNQLYTYQFRAQFEEGCACER